MSAALQLSEILKGMPAGAWVAVSEGKQKVVAYGSDVQAVLSEARDKGEELPLILKVPERQEILFF